MEQPENNPLALLCQHVGTQLQQIQAAVTPIQRQMQDGLGKWWNDTPLARALAHHSAASAQRSAPSTSTQWMPALAVSAGVAAMLYLTILIMLQRVPGPDTCPRCPSQSITFGPNGSKGSKKQPVYELAMAKEEVKARLAPVPVYTVANPKNEFVLVAGEVSGAGQVAHSVF